MNTQINGAMTALEHVREAYLEEYEQYLTESAESYSEETALLFLASKERELEASLATNEVSPSNT